MATLLQPLTHNLGDTGDSKKASVFLPPFTSTAEVVLVKLAKTRGYLQILQLALIWELLLPTGSVMQISGS